MRSSTLLALSALCVAGMLSSHSTLAQQPEVQRKVLNKVTPHYPDLARQKRLEGTVKLEVVVAPNGMVKSMQAVGGSPVLIKAAQDAICKWKWAPAGQESTELIELRFHPD